LVFLVQFRYGLAFYTAIFVSFATIGELPTAALAKPIVLRHLQRRTFDAPTYVLTALLAALPLPFVQTIILTTLDYWVTGFAVSASRFLYSLLVLILSCWALGAFFRVLAHGCRRSDVAQMWLGPILGFMLCMAGFLITPNDLPTFWHDTTFWFASPFAWIMRALVYNEFSDARYDTPATTADVSNGGASSAESRGGAYAGQRVGDVYLYEFQVEHGQRWRWLVLPYLFAVIALSLGASVLALRFRRIFIPLRTPIPQEDRVPDEPDFPPKLDDLGSSSQPQPHTETVNGSSVAVPSVPERDPTLSTNDIEQNSVSASCPESNLAPGLPTTAELRALLSVPLERQVGFSVRSSILGQSEPSGMKVTCRPGTLSLWVGSAVVLTPLMQRVLKALRTGALNASDGQQSPQDSAGRTFEVLVNPPVSGAPSAQTKARSVPFVLLSDCLSQSEQLPGSLSIFECLQYTAELSALHRVDGDGGAATPRNWKQNGKRVANLLLRCAPSCSALSQCAMQQVGDVNSVGISEAHSELLRLLLDVACLPPVLLVSLVQSVLSIEMQKELLCNLRHLAQATGITIVCAQNRILPAILDCCDELSVARLASTNSEEVTLTPLRLQLLRCALAQPAGADAASASFDWDSMEAALITGRLQDSLLQPFLSQDDAEQPRDHPTLTQSELSDGEPQPARQLKLVARIRRRCLHVWTLVRMHHQRWWRESVSTVHRVLISLVLSTVLGLIFFRLDLSADEYQLLATMFVLYVLGAFGAVLTGTATMPPHLRARTVALSWVTQRRLYSPTQYVCCHVMVHAVQAIFYAFCLLVPCYFLSFPEAASSPSRFFQAYTAVYCLLLFFTCWSLFLSLLFPTPFLASAVQAFSFNLMLLFGGVFQTQTRTPAGWKWFWYITPVNKFCTAVWIALFRCEGAPEQSVTEEGRAQLEAQLTALDCHWIARVGPSSTSWQSVAGYVSQWAGVGQLSLHHFGLQIAWLICITAAVMLMALGGHTHQPLTWQ
jgi:hypothetical protein